MQYSNPPLPSGIYSGGNVKFDSRQAAAMLHQDQLRRQMMQQKQASELDGMMKGEIGKVRSADQGPLVDAYNNFKNITKATLFDRKLQRDPKAFAEAQRQSQLAYRNFMTLASASQERKRRDEELDKAYLTNPDRFDDNYSNLRSLANKTPLNQLGAVGYNGQTFDLGNDDNYLYKGSNTDFNKIINEAAGKATPKYNLEEAVDKNGLQTKITPYLYGNNPAVIASNLTGAFAKHGVGRDAAYMWEHTTPEEVQNTYTDYNAISADRLKKMGIDKLPDLTIHDGDSKPVKLAKYMAMRHAIEAEPEVGEVKYRTNEAKKLQMEQANRIAAADHNMALWQKKFDQKAKGTKQDAAGLLNDAMDSLEKEAKNHPVPMADNKAGKVTTGYDIPLTQAVARAVSLPGDKSAPNAVRLITEDGKKYIQTINYAYDDKNNVVRENGKPVIDVANSHKIPIKEFRTALGKQMFSGKILYNELGQPMNEDEIDFGDGSEPPAPTKGNTKMEDYRKKYDY